MQKLAYGSYGVQTAQAANGTIYSAWLCTVEFQLNAVEFSGGPSGIRWQNVELDPIGFEREILKSAPFFGAPKARDLIAGDSHGVMSGPFKPV